MSVTVFGLALVGAASVFKPSVGSLVTSPAHAALGMLSGFLRVATVAAGLQWRVFIRYLRSCNLLHQISINLRLIINFISMTIRHVRLVCCCNRLLYKKLRRKKIAC